MITKSKQKPPVSPVQPAQNGFSLISNAKLMALYSTMLKCRILAERLQNLLEGSQLRGEFVANTGCEAAAVGVAIDMLPEDTLVSAPGDFVPSFINGLPLEKLFADLFHPTTTASGIAARLKVATDSAISNKRAKSNKITVAFSTSDAAFLGHFQKSMSLAGRQNLPMIFVCWKSSKTKAHSFPTITVDGNDVVAVYRVASEAISHARKGNGPTLIECQQWEAGDPILTMESYLDRKGIFVRDDKAKVGTAFSKELDAAIASAQKLPEPMLSRRQPSR